MTSLYCSKAWPLRLHCEQPILDLAVTRTFKELYIGSRNLYNSFKARLNPAQVAHCPTTLGECILRPGLEFIRTTCFELYSVNIRNLEPKFYLICDVDTGLMTPLCYPLVHAQY